MFDIFLEKLKELFKSRLLPVTIVYSLLIVSIVFRLFQLQIVQGEEYANKYEEKTLKERDISGTRGNIYDVNGKLLAYNELSYSVTLQDTGTIKESVKLNAMILKMIKIIEHYGGTIDLDFGLKMNDDGEVSFTEEGKALLRFKRDVYSKSNVNELNKEQIESDAEEVFRFLCSKDKDSLKFDIGEGVTRQEAFKILTIRYAMYLNGTTRYKPITIASNVNDEIIAAIKENMAELPGVDISQEIIRVYDKSIATSMAHILGYTGKISDETWEEFEEEGKDEIYTQNDQVGKTGLEKEFEDYLHGTKGFDQITLNETNRIVDITAGEAPSVGNDLHLTIDSDLQNAAYTLLEKEIAGLLLDKIVNSTNANKGGPTKLIKIPIYEVYYSLLKNGVVDITHFTSKSATDTEKRVYNTFLSEQKAVMKSLRNTLSYNNKTKIISLDDDSKEYVNYIYSVLIENEVIDQDKLDKEDEIYKKFENRNNDKIKDPNKQISMSEFLRYAIGKEWVNREIFSDPEEYYTSETIYQALIDYVIKVLEKDKEFSKMIYRNIIYSKKITGTQICLLLFDQGVLKYNEKDVNALKSNSKSPYSFMLEKIKSLEITPAQLALEPCSGSIVITDTKTGKVKALVSYPGYDNNKLANKIDSDYYSYLNNSGAYPLINRPLQQKTAPGSTYKMLVGIAGLEEHKITTTQTIQDKGVFKEVDSNKPPKCWFYPHSHGSVNVSHALEVSCNYFFYQVGYWLSKDSKNAYNSIFGLNKIGEYAKMFGFDSKSGIELPEYEPHISDEDSIRSAIGQGKNNYAPAQLSKYVTSIATTGKVYDLSIVDKVVNTNGETIYKKDSVVEKELKNVKSQNWNAIKEGMNLVVNGSESSIKSLFEDVQVEVAGKTGTAQENKLKPDHALFVSYAPFDDPEISVTTVIPNGYASANAAELTSKVYKYYFEESKSEQEKILKAEVTKPKGSSSGD